MYLNTKQTTQTTLKNTFLSRIVNKLLRFTDVHPKGLFTKDMLPMAQGQLSQLKMERIERPDVTNVCKEIPTKSITPMTAMFTFHPLPISGSCTNSS